MCARGVGGPLREGLAPGHADVVVNLAVRQERALHCIPEAVAGAAACECPPTTAAGARRPRAAAAWRAPTAATHPPTRGRGAVMAEGVGQLTPYEQFVEPLGGALRCALRRLARETERRDHAVVQVRRHAAHAIEARGFVAGAVVPVDAAGGDELVPARVARACTTGGVRHRADGVVDAALRHDCGEIRGGQIHRLEGQRRHEGRAGVRHVVPGLRHARAAFTRRGIAIRERTIPGAVR